MGEAHVVRIPDRFIDGQTQNIKNATGYEPNTCAWRALSNPLLATVMDLYRAASTGEGACHPASALALNPSHVAWQGLLVYVDAIARVRAFDRKKKQAENAKPKTSGAAVYRG